MGYKYAIDWDGTCVEEEWPGMGDWIKGAPEALRRLQDNGGVVITTLRVSPLEPGATLSNHVARPAEDVQFEMDRVRAKLDSAGLFDVDIWPGHFGKAPAAVYVDDRNLLFEPRRGGWRRVLSALGQA